MDRRARAHFCRQKVLIYVTAPALPSPRGPLLATAALLLPLGHCLLPLALVEAGLFAHRFLHRFVRELRLDPETHQGELIDYFHCRVAFSPADIRRVSLRRDHATLWLGGMSEQFLLVVSSREAIKNELLFAEFLARGSAYKG